MHERVITRLQSRTHSEFSRLSPPVSNRSRSWFASSGVRSRGRARGGAVRASRRRADGAATFTEDLPPVVERAVARHQRAAVLVAADDRVRCTACPPSGRRPWGRTQNPRSSATSLLPLFATLRSRSPRWADLRVRDGPKSAPTSSRLREPRSSGVSSSSVSSDVPDSCAGVVPPAEAGPPRRHRDKLRGARGGAASAKHPRVRVAAGSEAGSPQPRRALPESSRAPLGVAADSPTGLVGQKPWDGRARHAATLAPEL